MEGRLELKTVQFWLFLLYLVLGSGVVEVVEGLCSVGNDRNGPFNKLEDFVLLEDASDHQNREF